MTETVFVGTSAWLALHNPDDPRARQATQFLEQQPALITSNFVIDETITLALQRVGHRAAVRVGTILWSERMAEIAHVTLADQQAAWALFQKYDDKKFSFTDCTSFAIMLRFNLTEAFTFDDDFVKTGLFSRVP